MEESLDHVFSFACYAIIIYFIQQPGVSNFCTELGFNEVLRYHLGAIPQNLEPNYLFIDISTTCGKVIWQSYFFVI